MLLEEYIAPERAAVPGGQGPWLIVLSARSEQALRAGAGRLADHLAARRADGEPDLPLDDVAFTLRVGREPMPWRLALLVQDTDDLLDLLDSCRGGSFDGPGVLAGEAAGRPAAGLSPNATADELARHWIAGGDLPDPRVRGAVYTPRRVPLPGYPFAPTRYWADASQGATEGSHGTADVPQTSGGSAATPETDAAWVQLLNDLRDGVRSLEEVDDMLVLGDGGNQ
ncbi:hypothetical protein SVIO_103690 [Streptomyces violaceusniger]|uniref:RhiE-like KS-MAT linker domain-containing protein n=1 Tax=Streptomyces violaceusniger TaxID=68280 RepID=A0A4D4LKD6_STRVO|nr:hypothetical protein SVIO_103690 [Streptomyces violaceusniger]